MLWLASCRGIIFKSIENDEKIRIKPLKNSVNSEVMMIQIRI